ncbi:MAG: copper resistance CopC family protein [Pseudomonadota bacterium]
MLLRQLACALLTVIVATTAYAHSKMTSSVPREGTTVKAGLPEITLGFSKPVRLILVKVRNKTGKEDVKTGFKPATGFGKAYPVDVQPLTVGTYQVNWTAIAKDGHIMKGTLSFSVAK